MMTDAEFALLAREVATRSGYALSPDLAQSVEARLTPLLRRENFSQTGEFIAAARSDPRLWDVLADALVVQETRFFRDRALFKTLREETLPVLFKIRGEGSRLRILSAGCSTGQEAFSLAMVLNDFRASGEGGGEVVAIDYSERLLDKARAGLFSQFEVQRGLPIRTLITHFERTSEIWRISEQIRGIVRFEKRNLRNDISSLGPFDVALCCNVLSGMTADVRRATIENLAASLKPDGVLAISEEQESGVLDGVFTLLAPGLYQRDANWRKAA